MDEGCGMIIGFLIVAALIVAFVVYVVLPLSLFILGGIGLAGAISGVGVACYNFQQVLVEAHKNVR
jgi:hypothetical protein